MTKSTLQFSPAVVLACAVLFALASSMASTTGFRGAGEGCANLTLSDPSSAAAASRDHRAPRVSRMTG